MSSSLPPDYPGINLHLRASYDIIIVPAMSIINGRKKKKEIAPSFYAPRQQYRDLSYRIIDRLDNIFISF